MNWADIVILAIIGISAIIAVFRGFVSEVMSIVVWVAAFWLGFALAGEVAPMLEPLISVPSARYVAGFLLILVGTLIVGGLISFLISKLVDKTGLSGTDRALGVLFGVLRGIVIVAILVVLARATALPNDPWWQESMLLVHFDQLAATIVSYLPPDVAKHFTVASPVAGSG